MSRKDKLLSRLSERPRDFTWNELVSLLKGFGYQEVKGGKTGGSRRRFVHSSLATISLHKPHPERVLKMYQVGQVLEILEEEGLL